MKPLDWAAAFTVIGLWGFNFVVAKVGVGELPPLLLLALRFTLVAALLVPFLKPLGDAWRPMLVLSVVLGGCHFGLLFVGLSGVDAGPAAIAIQLTVPFSALLAWIVYGETMGGLQILGMIIAFTGVYVLAGEPASAPSLVHFLLVVGGALAWAVANILIKKLRRVPPMVMNAWFALFTAPQLLVVSLVVETGQAEALAAAGWRGWGAVVYTALGASIVAYGLWYWLLGKHDVNRIVPLMLLAPVLAVFLAGGLLGEPITPRILVGGAVTLAGVAMIQFLKPSRTPAIAP
ncbi:MAG: EamA/RhaT family transporter [Rhodospirillales bacterium]|nr:MAG: EamA/RhaT family transporter [Rhodospirillales bacterium]